MAQQDDIGRERNNQLLDNWPGELHTLFSANTVHGDDDSIPPEHLQTLETASLPPAHLRLKLGAPVMLLRDVAPHNGLTKGTRLRVTRIGRLILEVQNVDGAHQGEKHLLPRIPMTSAEGELPWLLIRRQFPVRLCFAETDGP